MSRTTIQPTFEQRLADLFGMNDEAWARHSNPRSVWSRLTCLPAILLSLWAFAWIGPWAILLLALALWWTWHNPRAFPPPASTDNWASRAVLGERLWMERHRMPVPERHRTVPKILTMLAVAGLALALWGTLWLSVGTTLLGLVIVYLAKLWFADRMVWLHQDMAGRASPARPH